MDESIQEVAPTENNNTIEKANELKPPVNDEPDIGQSPGSVKQLQEKFEKSINDDPEDGEEEDEEDVGNTKLHTACLEFDVETVQRIVTSKEVGVNRVNKNYCSALHVMVQNYLHLHPLDKAEMFDEFKEILSLLVTNGLDINLTDVSELTALHYAATKSNHPMIIKSLQAAGAKVNQRDRHYNTALHKAVKKLNLSNIKALMEGGADPDVRNSEGRTPLHIAAAGKKGATEVIPFLLKCGADSTQTDRGLRTPLHCAVIAGRKDNVRALLDGGSNLNVLDSAGQTPLHLAVTHDATGDIVRILIERGANINAQDGVYGETPTHRAVRLNMLHIFKILVEYGAKPRYRIDPNVQDSAGETALHIAATCSVIMVWSKLLRLKADIYVRNSAGLTAHQKVLKARNNVALAVIRQYDDEA